ncbi:right-handed parallel beta-helix repeat-containing protein [candidate division KSB1 bacterium]
MKLKNSINILTVLTATLLFIILFPHRIFPNVYYVDQSHSSAGDSNPGTENQPWLTIQHAAQTAREGDTVFIKKGIYTEKVLPAYSGTAENPIVYKNFSKDAVTLTNGSMTGYCFEIHNKKFIIIEGITFKDSDGWINIDSSNYITVNNCIFSGSRRYNSLKINNGSYNKILNSKFLKTKPYKLRKTTPYPFIPVGADYISIIRNSNYNLIEGNEFHEVPHVAVFIHCWRPGNKAEFNVIRNNIFDNPRWKAIGIHNLEHTLIENNRFIGKAANFIQFETEKVILRKNIFCKYKDSTNGIPEKEFRGVFRIWSHYDEYNCPDFARHNRIYNNVFYGNERTISTYKRTLEYPIFDNIFKNNIFYNNKQTILFHSADYKTVNKNYFLSNVIYGTAPDQKLINLYGDLFTVTQAQKQMPELYKGNLEVNPGFVDEQNDDYRLTKNSPCIDAGSYLTKTTDSGTGTQINVEDASYFTDGWGIIKADLIQIGTNTPVRITNIDYDKNIISVEKNISWNTGNEISLPYNGSAPDIGVYEFNSAAESNIKK